MLKSLEGSRAFIDAVLKLREAVGIAATSEKIQPADFDYLTDLAVAEGVSYFAPKLLDARSTKEILAKLAA